MATVVAAAMITMTMAAAPTSSARAADAAGASRLAEIIRDGASRGENPMTLLFGALAQMPDVRLDQRGIDAVLAESGFAGGTAAEVLAPFTLLEKRGNTLKFRSRGSTLNIPGADGATVGRVRFDGEGELRLRLDDNKVRVDKVDGISVGAGADGSLYALKKLTLSARRSGETDVELTAGWGIFTSTERFVIPKPDPIEAPPPAAPPPPPIVETSPAPEPQRDAEAEETAGIVGAIAGRREDDPSAQVEPVETVATDVPIETPVVEPTPVETPTVETPTVETPVVETPRVPTPATPVAETPAATTAEHCPTPAPARGLLGAPPARVGAPSPTRTGGQRPVARKGKGPLSLTEMLRELREKPATSRKD